MTVLLVKKYLLWTFEQESKKDLPLLRKEKSSYFGKRKKTKLQKLSNMKFIDKVLQATVDCPLFTLESL